ncbi:hypothetical protein [Azospirillum sp.]|nr:hypothetical protein [Azospirillum sp.]
MGKPTGPANGLVIAAIPVRDGGNREPELEPTLDCMMIACKTNKNSSCDE